MRGSFSVLFCVLFLSISHGQPLYPFNNEALKYGLMDSLGNVKIKAQFDNVSFSSKCGLYVVEINDKFGVINAQGNFIIQPKFQDTGGFWEGGLASVKQDGKWGFIDEKGNIVIDFKYDDIGLYFTNNLTPVAIGENYFFINQKGETKIPGPFSDAKEFDDYWGRTDGVKDIAVIVMNDKFGVIDTTGKIIIEPLYDNINIFDSETIRVSVNGKRGVIGRDGNFIIDPIFFSIYGFDENGIATVIYDNGDRVGAVNRKGEFLGFRRQDVD